MKTPFIYGMLAFNDEFTDRETELANLVQNFESGINSILISPRRWGKSSLVQKAIKTGSKNKNLKFCSIDLFNVRTETEFYELLAQTVIKTTESKWENRAEMLRKFLSGFIPKLSYSPGSADDFSISLDWDQVKKNPDQILNLAEEIAKEKGIHIIICIDEFQNVSAFKHALAFQKKLRSNWQLQKNVSYCLYGSKRHMMMNLFNNSSMPFYLFGEFMFLEKIQKDIWEKFIVERFKKTGKKITLVDAGLIADYCENHPYYVQQLAQKSWLLSDKVCTTETVNNAIEKLIMQLSLLFQNVIDGLSNGQINYLKAYLAGGNQLTSASSIKTFHLVTSASALKARQALINKEIIDMRDGTISMLDPILKLWLQRYYFIH